MRNILTNSFTANKIYPCTSPLLHTAHLHLRHFPDGSTKYSLIAGAEGIVYLGKRSSK